MITATVKRNNLRMSVRKVRLILNAIRQKPALAALDTLQFMNKDAATDVALLLKSGIAAAKQKDANEDILVIQEAFAGQGTAMKRRRLRNRGSSTVIKKMFSHITITVSEQEVKAKVTPAEQSRLAKAKSGKAVKPAKEDKE